MGVYQGTGGGRWRRATDSCVGQKGSAMRYPYQWEAFVEFGYGEEPVTLGIGSGRLGHRDAMNKLGELLDMPGAPKEYGCATLRVCGGDPMRAGFVVEYSIGPDVGNEWFVTRSEDPEFDRVVNL